MPPASAPESQTLPAFPPRNSRKSAGIALLIVWPIFALLGAFAFAAPFGDFAGLGLVALLAVVISMMVISATLLTGPSFGNTRALWVGTGLAGLVAAELVFALIVANAMYEHVKPSIDQGMGLYGVAPTLLFASCIMLALPTGLSLTVMPREALRARRRPANTAEQQQARPGESSRPGPDELEN